MSAFHDAFKLNWKTEGNYYQIWRLASIIRIEKELNTFNLWNEIVDSKKGIIRITWFLDPVAKRENYGGFKITYKYS